MPSNAKFLGVASGMVSGYQILNGIWYESLAKGLRIINKKYEEELRDDNGASEGKSHYHHFN